MATTTVNYPPYNELKMMEKSIGTIQQGTPPLKLRPSHTAVSHMDDAARSAKKREFEDKLRFLKRRYLPTEFVTKTIAEHVEKKLKTNNTDLWERVNERFQKDPTRRKIFVKGIDFIAKDEEMEMVFSQFGTVERLNLMRQADNRSKGFGFIMFKTDHGARAAVAAKSVMYKNREMKISAAIPEHLKIKRGLTARGYGNAMMGRRQFGGNMGFGGTYGGYGWGYGYGGLYGAAPIQHFGGGQGAGVLVNTQWAANGVQRQPAAATVQLNAGLPQQQLHIPTVVAPYAPYPSVTNPPYTQSFSQPAAGALVTQGGSSLNAQANASVVLGSAAAYYTHASPEVQTTPLQGPTIQ